MDLVMHRDSDELDFFRVTKILRDANGLHIGTVDNNPLLDTRTYEMEYRDGHKASLVVNTIP